MHDLESLLGQAKLIGAIQNWLSEQPDQNKLLVLKGVSGTGKTFLTYKTTQLWENLSDENKSIRMQGDSSTIDRPLFPWVVGIEAARSSLNNKEKAVKGFSDASKGVPFAGDFLSYLIDLLANRKKDSVKNKLAFLNQQEQEVLLAINSYYRNSNLLLVADNFHYWDQFSIDLLNFILSGKLEQSFPFIQRMRVMIVITDDQITDSLRESIDKFLSKHDHTILETETLKKESFEEAFHLLGGKGKLNQKTQNLLFSLTGGHLELIKRLAAIPIISEGGDNPLLPFDEQNFNGNNQAAFVEKILITRLQLLGAEASHIIRLLEYASVIGFSFTYEEICCLIKDEQGKINEIISQAENAALINNDSSRNHFSHEIIRQFFSARLGNKKYEYYRNFADCLRILRPSEYFERAGLLFEAGQVKEAITLYIVGSLKNIRTGLLVPSKTSSRIKEFAGEYDLANYYAVMKKSYEGFLKGEYQVARKSLLSLEDIYSDVLVAEKYYLLSLCMGKSLDSADLLLAKNYLLEWEKLKNTESEVWIRIMLTLMSRHAHLNEYDQAALIERKVMSFLIKRIDYDADAEFGINILRRKASILHIGEIACKRTSESLAYFGHRDQLGIYRSPIQYFMALVNHSGNLIVGGGFSEANQTAQESLSLQKTYSEIVFPRIEVAVNNYIVSGFLSETLDAKKSIQLFDSLFKSIQNPNDRILLQNNYVVMNALSADVDGALSISNQLWKLLSNSSRKDEYYTYFVGVNRAVLFYMVYGQRKATELLDTLASKIPSIPDKVFLAERHRIIRELFQKNKITDPVMWNRYILENRPSNLGPAWKFWGQGFLFTDMQFWSDS